MTRIPLKVSTTKQPSDEFDSILSTDCKIASVGIGRIGFEERNLYVGLDQADAQLGLNGTNLWVQPGFDPSSALPLANDQLADPICSLVFEFFKLAADHCVAAWWLSPIAQNVKSRSETLALVKSCLALLTLCSLGMTVSLPVSPVLCTDLRVSRTFFQPTRRKEGT
jgi:hypothetical protein